MTPTVEIMVAMPEDRVALANMMQLYAHDFSELWQGEARGELGGDGLFAAYPLDAWWREPDHIPLLVKVGGFLTGFALLNATSHTGASLDRNMAEFFIVRKYRRSGVGTAAARMIFSRYPGRWETAVARANHGALAFWRAAIQPLAEEVELVDVESALWNGPVLRFRVIS
ncbi:MAG: GNAT family N-acetyltransferase [Sphingomonas bacterium]